MATLPTLVAPHAGVKASTTTATGPGSGNGDADTTARHFSAVRLPLGLFGILAVTVDTEGKAGYGSGHPNLLERSELAEQLLKVPLVGTSVKIGNVKAVSVLWSLVIKAPISAAIIGSSSSSTTASTSSSSASPTGTVRPGSGARTGPGARAT
jgi:hypothetical protein